MAFRQGSRHCLGMYLGNAESMMGIAGVMGRFGRRMGVVETRWERDMRVCMDFFTPMTRADGRGVEGGGWCGGLKDL